MRATDNLPRQHQELAAVADAIERALAPEDGHHLRRLLGRLSGKLQMHAAMEEKALYPRLIDHEREDVRAVAVRVRNDVGEVYAFVGAFIGRWSEAGAIERTPRGSRKRCPRCSLCCVGASRSRSASCTRSLTSLDEQPAPRAARPVLRFR